MADADGSVGRNPLVSRSLLLRALSALVLIPATVFIVYMGGWALAALVIAAGILMLHEWNGVTESGVAPGLFLTQSVVLMAVTVLVMENAGSALLVTAIVGTALTAAVARVLGKKPLWPVAGLFYVLLPALAFLWLRQQTDPGSALCLWTLAIVWATDIGGYAVGRLVGGPRLAPRFSPNKTWAGLAGGVAFAVATSAALGPALGLPQSRAVLAVLAAGLAVWEQAGDLLESAIKRRFGVKDSGYLIPGHGGIMDRVDGLVFVLPAVAAGTYLFLE